MRRACSLFAVQHASGAVRGLTAAGILHGVQSLIAARPKNAFESSAIKKATEEFIAFGFDGSYDKNFSHEQMADHVYGYLCAKVSATSDRILFRHEGEKHAFFFCQQKDDVTTMVAIEKWVKSRRSLLSTHAVSIRSYAGVDGNGEMVMLYDARLSPFADATGKGDTLESLASVDFKANRTAGAIKRYEELLPRLKSAIGPVYNIETLKKTGNTVINVGFMPDSDMYLDELTILVTSIPGARIVKKFLETFSNGRQVYSLYVRGASEAALADAVTMVGVMPNRPGHPYTRLYAEKKITAKEVVYAYAV